MRGVVSVVTASDVPRGLHGRGLLDTPILASGFVRYVCESVAAVAAETYEAAMEAVDSIDVEYERLPATFDVEESARETPPIIVHPELKGYKRLSSKLYRVKILPSRPNISAYQRIVFGDVQRVFEHADIIVEGDYTTAGVSHTTRDNRHHIQDGD
jgi:CO/xanthine dehydrogenase Mo-binding subunit